MRTTLALLVRLHLRRLWTQRLRTVLAIGAVAAGTSLAVGVAIVLSSTTASLDAFGRSVGGPAPLRVVGATVEDGIPASVAATVAATPGVGLAVPVVQLSSVVHATDGTDSNVVVIGAGCGAARLVGLQGCQGGAAGPDAVLVSASLRRTLGPAAWLQTDLGVLPLGAALPSPALDGVAGGRVVVTGLVRAQGLFARGHRVDVVYVVPRPGVTVATLQARLAARVGPAFGVLTAGQPPPALDLATTAFVPLLVLVAAIAAAIAAVLVYDVVALSLEEHRRQQAVVAAVGAPPWVLAAGPVTEAVAVGAAGGALAVAGGTALAGPVLAPLSTFTSALFGVPIGVHVSVGDAALGVVFGVIVGLLAAARPVRRLRRFDTAAELSGSDRRQETGSRAGWRRVAVGAVALAAGTVLAYLGSRHDALAAWQLPVAIAGFLLAVLAGAVVVGAGASLPFVALTRSVAGHADRRRDAGGHRAAGRRIAAVHRAGSGVAGHADRAAVHRADRAAVHRAGRRRAGGGRGARARLVPRLQLPPAARMGVLAAGREPGRVGVMAVAVAAAAAVGTITGGYAQGLAAQVTSPTSGAAPGGAVVVNTVAGTSGDNAAAHIPAWVVPLLAATPGVAGVDTTEAVLSGSSASSLVLVGSGSPSGGPALEAGSDRLAPFRAGAVMVGVGLARSRGLHPGGTVALDTPDGVRRLPVEGVWDDGAVGGDNVTMQATELTRLFGPQLPITARVVPAVGTTTAELLQELRRLPLPPDVQLTAPGPYRQQQADQLTAQLAPFWTLEHGLLVVAFVGVLATLLLVGLGRRRETAVLGAVGLPPAGVIELVVSEAVSVALVGAVGGVLLGAAVLAVLLLVVPLEVGFAVPYRFDLGVVATVVPLSVAVAAAAALLPAWQAARRPVVDGLRQE